MPKLYVEVSEIMAAVAMLMTPAKITKYSKDFQGLVDFLKEGKELADSNKVEYGSPADKTEFLKAFNPTEKDFLREAAIGISAANSIRGWVPSRSRESGVPIQSMVCDKVYLTGDTWPKEVQKYQVEAYGFKSYNSSDMICRWGNSFYGISLKKKPMISSPDPTIINKAFDSVLQSDNPKEIKEYDKIKKEVIAARESYFARVVREAVKEKKLYITGNTPLPSDDKKLMAISLQEKKGKNRKLIDLKGIGNVDLSKPKDQADRRIFGENFTKGDLRNPDISLRAFVNAKLASKDSVYNAMIGVMNKHSEVFAKALLNLVLKTDLYDILEDNTFAFALVTGIAKLDNVGNPIIAVEKAKGLHTVLCGLSALNKESIPYEMILDEKMNAKSSGAKVYLKLVKGKLTVLNMELRYKGSFSSQPQFFATLSDDFKTLLYEKCLLP